MEVNVRNAKKDGYYLELKKEAGSIIMHSKYAPIKQAKKWYKEWEKSGEGEQLIVLGGGLGYFPAELEAHGHNCVVLELLPAFEVPEDSPAARLQQAGKHFFVHSHDQLKTTLAEMDNEFLQNARPVIHPHYQELYPQRLTELREQLILEGRHQLRERQTRRKFFWLWFDNLLENLPELEETQQLQSLKGYYSGAPAVIVGAGPSTGKALNWLREFQDKFLILAADTSVKILAKAAVTPDFVLTTDPQADNGKYIQAVEETSNLIGSWSARPEYFKWAKNSLRFPTYISHQPEASDPVFPFAQWLHSFVDGVVPLQSGGSVTTTALDFAQFIGAGKMGIVGVDHLFTYHRAVSKGAHWEEQQLQQLSRFNTLAGAHLNSFLGTGKYSQKKTSLVTSRRGRKYYTTDEYQKQNSWFEEAAGTLPQPCLDFREDGLPMENWKPIDAPANYWAEQEVLQQKAPAKLAPANVKVDWESIGTEGQKLLDYLNQNRSDLKEQLPEIDTSLPLIIRELYSPFQEYQGLNPNSPAPQPGKFIDKLSRRLQKLVKIAESNTET